MHCMFNTFTQPGCKKTDFLPATILATFTQPGCKKTDFLPATILAAIEASEGTNLPFCKGT